MKRVILCRTLRGSLIRAAIIIPVAIAALWIGARAEDKQPEPTIEQLKAELAQTKEQLATLGQRLQITTARCEALATFYQADAALKALDAPKQKGPGK